jgi:beta-phosphoglucomutase
MNNIRLVIFDLDGVLTETTKQHYLAWKTLASELGINIDLVFNETLKGVSRMDSLDRILKRGNMLDKYTDEEKVEMATKKNDNYVKMIKSFTGDNLFDGVLDLLIKLKDMGILIALGSASKNGPRLLKSMGVYNYFDYIVNPAEVKGKPNPDIFLKASEELHIPIENCIGIEDAVSGIEAIKKANIFAVGIGSKDILFKADIIYAETKDIDLEVIDKLLKK